MHKYISKVSLKAPPTPGVVLTLYYCVPRTHIHTYIHIYTRTLAHVTPPDCAAHTHTGLCTACIGYCWLTRESRNSWLCVLLELLTDHRVVSEWSTHTGVVRTNDARKIACGICKVKLPPLDNCESRRCMVIAVLTSLCEWEIVCARSGSGVSQHRVLTYPNLTYPCTRPRHIGGYVH